ncbi:MAG: hypothetical protein HUK25_04580 [Treponema sp.]|nr:hypothetical protein [Treponema sp.]
MKKLFSTILLVGMLSTTLFSQTAGQPEIEAKENQDVAVSEEMQSIQTAFQLADYGYKYGSASSLLCAAEILAEVPTQKLDVEVSQEETTEKDSISEKKEYSAEQLLEDGKKYAGKDKTLLAYAKTVEKKVKAGTRGAFGGPKYAYSYVYGSSKTSYYNVGFVAGRYAEIDLYSLDGADLDLYVYDENWNLIDKDTSYSTSAWVSFVPRWDGIFHIVVKNNSRYLSYFKLFTN